MIITPEYKAAMTLVDTIAKFFTEDPPAFEGYEFYIRIANGADAESVGRAALVFLENETDEFYGKLASNTALDPWSFAELVYNLACAYPAYLLEPLGERLIAAFTPYV